MTQQKYDLKTLSIDQKDITENIFLSSEKVMNKIHNMKQKT